MAHAISICALHQVGHRGPMTNPMIKEKGDNVGSLIRAFAARASVRNRKRESEEKRLP